MLQLLSDDLNWGCGGCCFRSQIFEGQQYRKLEDKEDKDHFGPRADPLMPQAHNMATNIGALFCRCILL